VDQTQKLSNSYVNININILSNFPLNIFFSIYVNVSFDFNFGFELETCAFIILCVNRGIARGGQVAQVQSKGRQKLL